jgi:hypothetical protein
MRLKNRLTWALFPKPETGASKPRLPNLVTRPAPRASEPRRVLRLGFQWVTAAWRSVQSALMIRP